MLAELKHNASGAPAVWAALNEKKMKDKASHAKKRLNHEAAPAMTLQEFEQVDAQGEVHGWFQKMATYLN